MFAPVYPLLKNASAVTAILGSPLPRAYPHGDAPQDKTKPYVTWQVIDIAPQNTLSETPAVDFQPVQVNCFHQTQDGVESLAKAVRDAIEPAAHWVSTPIDLRDPETKLFWIAMQFDFWVSR
jgi:hypothetical protein